MNQYERIASLSPLPIVDLNNPGKPQDGFFRELNGSCRKYYDKNDLCLRHYQSLQAAPSIDQIVQCPYGFATAAYYDKDLSFALTGFIPHPRLGGTKETIQAKRHKEMRVTVEGVNRAAAKLKETNENFTKMEEQVLKGYSMALHEIRKLNRTVKHNAERLCKKESPDDLDKAQKELVTIYKTSELMSNEFDVIEILADASQANLPLNTTSDLYKIFDKCVRIYGTRAGGRRLILRAQSNYSPRIAANDKTFHILPSVFIENALKYSSPGSETRITLEPDTADGNCVVTIVNESDGQQILDDRIFERGYRANPHPEGSGNGLYVAQLIAKQHKSQITVKSCRLDSTRVRHTFSMVFKTTTERWLRKGQT